MGKRGIFQLLSSSRKMLVKLLPNEIGLGRIVENPWVSLRSIDAEKERIVLDERIER